MLRMSKLALLEIETASDENGGAIFASELRRGSSSIGFGKNKAWNDLVVFRVEGSQSSRSSYGTRGDQSVQHPQIPELVTLSADVVKILEQGSEYDLHHR